ncbi:lytic transglycosylase domain-containing protein [Candidatus Entotheonella palauensis]|nr:lytic transglycosylase domain-containing protein [Candidatus Entotheonella palauensis]
MGWEIDMEALAAPVPNVHVEGMPEIFDELPVEWPPEPVRTLAWHEDLLQILSHPGASRQALRPPVPSTEAVCDSLDVVLPYVDLAVDHLPERLRQKLCKRIRTYAVRHRRDVQTMLHRADAYLPMIKRRLREHGLPTYYAYVPLVESAFQVDAMHRGSGARGLWQLLRNTARARGLTVSKAVDERLHPRRATEAAVSYLVHLHKRFGDYGPLYVLAAYNYGETNLSRKIRRFGPPAIASLYRPGYVPGETREYLLRMMTMWVIAAHPGRFHFLLREAVDPPLPGLEAQPQDNVPQREVPVGVADGSATKVK